MREREKARERAECRRLRISVVLSGIRGRRNLWLELRLTRKLVETFAKCITVG